MNRVVTIPTSLWNQAATPAEHLHAISALEDGKVLFLPHLRFDLTETEGEFLQPLMKGNRKNISYDITTGAIRGGVFEASEAVRLRAMMDRFARSARDLVGSLLPRYALGLIQGRTSFRPIEIVGRVSSWRQDDTRLHVDSFPSSPVQGKRILRVFSNVNPNGRSRSWRLGEPFESVARRYLQLIPKPLRGSSRLLEWCRITKSRRSLYDHFMLQLHDRMKSDLDYQQKAEQVGFDFLPGTTWLVYTDQVSHAAMAGQHSFEQTFYVPVSSMAEAAKSPLRILEKMTGKALV